MDSIASTPAGRIGDRAHVDEAVRIKVQSSDKVAAGTDIKTDTKR